MLNFLFIYFFLKGRFIQENQQKNNVQIVDREKSYKDMRLCQIIKKRIENRSNSVISE